MTVSSPICAVWVSGKKLNAQTIQKIRQLRLTFPEKKAKSGEIAFLDPDHRLHDSKAFEKGVSLTFLFGWTHEIDFAGPYYVKSYKKSFPEAGDPRFIVKVQDKTYKMSKKQRRRRYTGSPEALMKKIAASHGMKYDIETIPGLTFTDDFPLMQANITDAALMHKLAVRYGYRWGVEGNILYFRKPDIGKETVGRQVQVPVLFYRMNDNSLRAFSPEVKFTNKRKRKNPLSIVNSLGEVDLDSNGLYNHDAAMTDIDIEAEVIEGELISTDFDDTDTDPDSDVDYDTDDSDLFDPAGEWDVEDEELIDEAGISDIDIETEDDDESGAAPPDKDAERELRQEAIRMRTTEVITGSAVPHTASVRYRAGDSVIFAGVGDRFSGKYRVTQVEQIITEGGEGFTTSLKVERRSFVRDYTVWKDIAEAKKNQRNPSGSLGGTPDKEVPLESKLSTGDPGFVNFKKVDEAASSSVSGVANLLKGF